MTTIGTKGSYGDFYRPDDILPELTTAWPPGRMHIYAAASIPADDTVREPRRIYTSTAKVNAAELQVTARQLQRLRKFMLQGISDELDRIRETRPSMDKRAAMASLRFHVGFSTFEVGLSELLDAVAVLVSNDIPEDRFADYSKLTDREALLLDVRFMTHRRPEGRDAGMVDGRGDKRPSPCR